MSLLQQLAEKKVLVSDGAWGTMLQARGLTTRECPEEWNVTHPDEVRAVAAAYAAAGSDLVLTNTFGGSRAKLEKRGLGSRVAELNAAGARLSLEGAPNAIIAGSVGPTGEFVEPLGTLSESDMEAVFAEQIAAMLGAGLRVICVETMTALEEAACAIRAARRLDRTVEVIATMTFDKTPGGYRTMMGIGPEQAAAALVEAGADVVGSNCGHGVRNMVDIAREFRRFTDRPILIHSNAGMPELVDGRTVFRETPQDMAEQVPALLEAGADIIGGCCGTTPDHIAAIRAAVDAQR